MSCSFSPALAVAAIGVAFSAFASAQTGNLLSNGQFDTDVSSWSTNDSPYGAMTFAPAHDVDGCAASGAAAASGSQTADFGSVEFTVCVEDLSPGISYLVAASFRFPSDAVEGYATVFPLFYDQPGCTGNFLPTEGFFAGTAHSDVATWQRFEVVRPSPDGAVSAEFHIHLLKNVGAEGPIELLVDEVVFASASYLFADGFEVNSDCRWD